MEEAGPRLCSKLSDRPRYGIFLEKCVSLNMLEQTNVYHESRVGVRVCVCICL